MITPPTYPVSLNATTRVVDRDTVTRLGKASAGADTPTETVYPTVELLVSIPLAELSRLGEEVARLGECHINPEDQEPVQVVDLTSHELVVMVRLVSDEPISPQPRYRPAGLF
jgi:hypothetical protein